MPAYDTVIVGLLKRVRGVLQPALPAPAAGGVIAPPPLVHGNGDEEHGRIRWRRFSRHCTHPYPVSDGTFYQWALQRSTAAHPVRL